jgi:DNA-directed RNA polymerase subunit RPC12/RpoP
MGKQNAYTCDCCGKHFEEPSYNNPSMGDISYSHTFNDSSIGNVTRTLMPNNETAYLCDSCNRKLQKALLSIGFRFLYEHASDVPL